uniref:SFRICE041962.2 n=1 Tax=Spodoptera frugiperda TaxID=7108 RepID=A0A2H1VPU6_SPOFR
MYNIVPMIARKIDTDIVLRKYYFSITLIVGSVFWIFISIHFRASTGE